MEAPQNPAGAFAPEEHYGPQRRDEFVAVIETAPTTLSTAVAGLSEDQLDTRYRNWTVRQIVHHMADSHANAYIRFKWTLTEEQPTIKPYDETRWAALEDSLTGDVRAPLAMLQGLHARWVKLMRAMTADQFTRSYFHPETGQTVSLSAALCQYAWHCRHHMAQILWVREQNSW
ncbi:MAG: yfiT 2 [Gemmataceae bacterium]|nr:yfiT 2 [Gemmataceae bacterium]